MFAANVLSPLTLLPLLPNKGDWQDAEFPQALLRPSDGLSTTPDGVPSKGAGNSFLWTLSLSPTSCFVPLGAPLSEKGSLRPRMGRFGGFGGHPLEQAAVSFEPIIGTDPGSGLDAKRFRESSSLWKRDKVCGDSDGLLEDLPMAQSSNKGVGQSMGYGILVMNSRSPPILSHFALSEHAALFT